MICRFLINPTQFISISFVEGRPPQVIKTKPTGDYVCKNAPTVFYCSFDEPALVLVVRWNIPDSADVDLSTRAGHDVNSTMMSEGQVTVTVRNSSHLEMFYGCTVVYNGVRSLEVSNNFLMNLTGKVGSVHSIYVCYSFCYPVLSDVFSTFSSRKLCIYWLFCQTHWVAAK